MKIVVGYDGSDHADRALDRALDLAGEGGELLVVSAARIGTLAREAGPVGGALSAVDPVEAEWARSNLDKALERAKARGVEVRTIEAHGDPADSLVQQAEDESADLIVVGTRGLNAAQRALLGSVSTKVVHHAACDVLVVR